jgi:hypothetical protein
VADALAVLVAEPSCDRRPVVLLESGRCRARRSRSSPAGWLVAGVRSSEPRETALAVDAEGRLGDRVSSALELAVGFPASAGPAADEVDDVESAGPLDETAETVRFVRRQRRDALSALRAAPSGLFAPRFSRRPAAAAALAILLLLPVSPHPEPAGRRHRRAAQVREAADRQAERIDRVADDPTPRARTRTI